MHKVHIGPVTPLVGAAQPHVVLVGPWKLCKTAIKASSHYNTAELSAAPEKSIHEMCQLTMRECPTPPTYPAYAILGWWIDKILIGDMSLLDLLCDLMLDECELIDDCFKLPVNLKTLILRNQSMSTLYTILDNAAAINLDCLVIDHRAADPSPMTDGRVAELVQRLKTLNPMLDVTVKVV
jgi:hypothetical protein